MFRSLRTARAPIAAVCRNQPTGQVSWTMLPPIQSRLMTTTTTTTTENIEPANTTPSPAAATTTISTPTPAAATAAESAPAASPPSSTADPNEKMEAERKAKKIPYFVERNKLYNLSVYHREFRGGNLKKTIVKNASGDLRALKEDLAAALQISQNDVSINTLTKHLMIKGHVKPKVLTFLSTMGF